MSNDAATQKAGVVFGDWKLIPIDSGNWEMAHRHVTGKGKNEGRTRWHRLGRFYQASTFANALEYAADQEARDGCRDAERDVREVLDELRSMLAEHRREMKEIFG